MPRFVATFNVREKDTIKEWKEEILADDMLEALEVAEDAASTFEKLTGILPVVFIKRS